MQVEKVVSIKKIGKIRTVDIEVNSKDHLFYGNGIATSNSHSVSYATLGYQTAYVKYHFPKEFFAAWLTNAIEKKKDKKKEIEELVADAKTFGIEVIPPSIFDLKTAQKGEFLIKGDTISFGFSNIKRIGGAKLDKLVKSVHNCERDVGKRLEDFTWFEFLTKYLEIIDKTSVQAIINCGALSHFGLSRNQMLYEYSIWDRLTKTEKKKSEGYQSLKKFLEDLSNIPKMTISSRVETIRDLLKLLNDKSSSTEDSIYYIVEQEKELMSTPLTCQKSDFISNNGIDVISLEKVKNKNSVNIGCEVIDCRESVIKTGKNKGRKMGYFSVFDSTGKMDNILCFADEWEEYSSLIYDGAVVNLELYCSEKEQGDKIFIVRKVSAAKQYV